MSCNQAVEVLHTCTLLLGARPPDLQHQVESYCAPPDRHMHGSWEDGCLPASPLNRGPQNLGRIARLDSALSHAQQAAGTGHTPFYSASQDMPSIGDDTPLEAAVPAAHHVARAMPPPPSHAEHALGQSSHTVQSAHDSKPPLPSWQSQAVEAHRRQSLEFQNVASRQQSRTSSQVVVSPFDEVRQHSSLQEGLQGPSGASDPSQSSSDGLHLPISQNIQSSQSQAAYRQSSLYQSSASICPASRQTSNASQHSQLEASRPSSSHHVAVSPIDAVSRTASLHANHKPSHANVQRSQEHGCSDSEEAEGKRFSNWADQQMAQSQTNADGSPALTALAQPELEVMQMHDLSNVADHKIQPCFAHACAFTDRYRGLVQASASQQS